jgi:hypothetical protein
MSKIAPWRLQDINRIGNHVVTEIASHLNDWPWPDGAALVV